MISFSCALLLIIQTHIASSGCGYYGQSSANITSPEIPLDVCGNYGFGYLSKSKMYECDHNGNLKLKIYQGHGCKYDKNSTLISTIDSTSLYECDGGKCYGHLVLETRLDCYDFSSGETIQCKCGESEVDILNINVCITTRDSSYIVTCSDDRVVYKEFTDQYCQEYIQDNIKITYEGCNENDLKSYTIHVCSGGMKTFTNSVIFIVWIAFGILAS